MCGVVLCSDEEPGVGRGAGQLRGAGEGEGGGATCTMYTGGKHAPALDGDLNK